MSLVFATILADPRFPCEFEVFEAKEGVGNALYSRRAHNRSRGSIHVSGQHERRVNQTKADENQIDQALARASSNE